MAATTATLVDCLRDRATRMSPASLGAARRLVLDVLGVAVAGASTREGRIVEQVMTDLRRFGDCPVPLSEHRFDLATGALVTGTMAYSIGLTDTHSQSITHPGPSVVPTALAVGHDVGADSIEVLRAIALGCETVVRIGAVVNPSHRSRGYHPTATCNPFGAAVAAGHLLGLDRERMLWALGLAGSMAGGLYEFRHEGAMLMALHGGLPAASGINAAYLARAGFTGPTTVLEGPDGFFAGFADEIRPDLLIPGDDAPFGIEEIALRPYNACRYAHAGIDALQRISAEHGPLDPDRIRRITVWTHATAVDQEVEPTTPVSARLSTKFTVALTVVHGPRLLDIGPDDLADQAVLALTDRTEVVEDPALTAMFPAKWACRVDVELDDGTVHSAQVDTPKGEPDNPLTDAETLEKFCRLAAPALGAQRAERVADQIAGDRLAGVLAELAGPTN
jgi:2-methylcitrate dehydratase PrpD